MWSLVPHMPHGQCVAWPYHMPRPASYSHRLSQLSNQKRKENLSLLSIRTGASGSQKQPDAIHMPTPQQVRRLHVQPVQAKFVANSMVLLHTAARQCWLGAPAAWPVQQPAQQEWLPVDSEPEPGPPVWVPHSTPLCGTCTWHAPTYRYWCMLLTPAFMKSGS